MGDTNEETHAAANDVGQGTTNAHDSTGPVRPSQVTFSALEPETLDLFAPKPAPPDPSTLRGQCRDVFTLIREHGSITSGQAFLAGVINLSGRICDLEDLGYQFDRETIEVTKGSGRGKTRVTRYSLKAESP